MEEDTSPLSNPKVTTTQPPTKGNKYMRYILDPFQIFAIEKRNEILSQNPQMKNSELTNILGLLWRRMTNDEKKVYHNLAMTLHNNKCIIQRGKRGPNKRKLLKYKEISQAVKLEASEPEINKETGNLLLKIPNIYIIPRGMFGTDASKASIQLSKSVNRKGSIDTG